MPPSGRVLYTMNVSLDGFVAAHDGSLDWTLIDDELHSWFNQDLRSMQASLYGRRLYELMNAYWPTAEDDPSANAVEREFAAIWKATPKVVFSSTLERVEGNARLVAGDVAEVLADLRTELTGDLEVGGPTLAGQFVRRGLVDEYRLVVHPVVLGSGKPFWPELDWPLSLRLTERHAFGSGAELRVYVPAGSVTEGGSSHD